MKTLKPLFWGVTLSAALTGCVTAQDRLTNAQSALDRHIANNLRTKAEKGAFYSAYKTPSDEEIRRLYGPGLSDEDLGALRDFAEQLTRRYETEIVWPAWIKSIKTKSMPIAEEAFQKGQYDKARETIWRAAATGVKPVDEGVREFGFEFLNTQVNPKQWREIEKEMCEKVLAFEKAGQYNEAIAWLKTVPYVREYSTVLDARLAKVKAELVKLSVPEAEVQPIIDATTALLDKVENIYDYTDSTKTESASSAAEVELEAYYKAVENFQKMLVRHNCTEANAAKLAQNLMTEASKLLQVLYTSTTQTTGALELGTGAINKRIDARRKAMIERLESAKNPISREEKLAALFAENNIDGVKECLKAEMDAVLVEQLNTEAVIVPGREVVSPLDLAVAGEKLRNDVRLLVKQQEFAKARELIWTTIYPKQQTLRSEYLRPIGLQLMLTVVNPANWTVAEAEMLQIATVTPASEALKQALAAYPRIKTYAQDIDARLDAAATKAATLGSPLSDAQKQAIQAAAAEMKNLVDQTDKQSNYTIAGTPVDRTSLDLLLEDYRQALIQYDCTAANAEKLVKMFNDAVQSGFAAIAADKVVDQLNLGCNALNARMDQLADKLVQDAIAREAKLAAEEAARAAAKAAFEAKINDFCKRVLEAVAAKDFETARALVRDEPLTDDAVNDAILYVVRVGMLNTTVNPAQYKVLSAEITEKVKGYVEAKDFDGLEQYVDGYAYVADVYEQVDAALKALQDAVAEATKNETLADANDAKMTDAITYLVENRDKLYVFQGMDLTDVKKALEALGTALKPHLEKAEIEKVLALLKLTDGAEPMTTAQVNFALRKQLDAAMVAVAVGKAEIAAEKYLARLAEIDQEVSADTQITLAEEAIRRQLAASCCASYKVNALLGEYARVFRDLKRQKPLTATQAAVMLLGAAYLDQDVVIERAIELGADVNATSERDPLARTALMIALEAQNTSLVKLLVEKGASVSATDAEGNSVMHYAVRSGSITAVKALAEGASVAVTNKAGETPLFTAAARNQAAMVEAILACVTDEARAAFVNTTNVGGQTAFRVAVTLCARDVLDALAEAGATFGPADLAIATAKDHLAVAQWLIEHSVDVNGEGVMETACPAKAAGRYLVKEGGISRHAPCEVCKPAEETPAAPAPVKPQPALISVSIGDAAPVVVSMPTKAEVKTEAVPQE